MEITEVRIKIVPQTQDRLLGFCSLTFDNAFVVRDLKIIQGGERPFVAMPSRKLTDRCRRCSGKNPYRANFCNQCGSKLHDTRAPRNPDGRAKLYADIAHPINSACREMIQSAVLQAFEEEKVLAQQPGYVSRYDDFGEESTGDYEEYLESPPRTGEGGTLKAEGADSSVSSPLSDEGLRHTTPPPPHVNISGGPGGTTRDRAAVKPDEASSTFDSEAADDFGAGLR